MPRRVMSAASSPPKPDPRGLWLHVAWAGFHGSLSNVDVSSDRNIDHLNIDKSARLHTQVLATFLKL
jgi:hypothetical protein